MLQEAAQIYQQLGIDLQPKWFTLMALLSEREHISVVQAAAALGLSQPAISQFSKQLHQRGYIRWQVDENDQRRKILALTERGREEIRRMQSVWTSVRAAATALCEETGVDFYQAIRRFEQAMSRKSLLQRTLEHHHENTRGH